MVGQWNISLASCCLNSLTTRALSGLELSSIKIILSSNGSLSKWSTACTLSTWSWYATPLRLHCHTCKSSLQLKRKHPRELHRRHRMLLYPSCSLPNMQCFYAAILKIEDRRCAKKIDFHLTNYEYWNGAGHEPTDDVMTVVVVLCVALHILDSHNSVDFEYKLIYWASSLSSLGVVLRVMPERGR